jgi:hypothetical protein
VTTPFAFMVGALGDPGWIIVRVLGSNLGSAFWALDSCLEDLKREKTILRDG